jgi:hypothetical protein
MNADQDAKASVIREDVCFAAMEVAVDNSPVPA